MEKRSNTRKRPQTVAAGSGAAVAPAETPWQLAPDLSTDEVHQEIARLAYSYWEDRGRPIGSPEVDWFRAEEDWKARQLARPA